MPDLWYPRAKKLTLPGQRTGGSMVGGPARGTVHTTETRGFYQPSNGGSPYHMQFRDLGNNQVEIRQYFPFNKAPRSLRNLSGGVQTNRQGVYHPNICIVEYAKNAQKWPTYFLNEIARFMRWAEGQYGIRRRSYRARGGGGECYGYNSPCRMSNAEWVGWSGWGGHQNVPENTHWDAGRIDWEYLMTMGAGEIPVPPPTEPEEDEEMAAAIEGIQRSLIASGFLAAGEDDGVWGPKTQAAHEAMTKAAATDLKGIKPGDMIVVKGDIRRARND